MLQALILVVLAAVPADPQVASDLLRSAERSKGEGDEGRALRAMVAWNIVAAGGTPPAALAAEHQAAVEALGALSLFVSTRPARVRIGLRDPAGLVSHVLAGAVDPTTQRRRNFPRDEGGPADRYELQIDPPLAPSEQIFAQAIMFFDGQSYVLEEVVLDDVVVPPPPPVLAAVESTSPEQTAADEDDALPWWWWAVGAVAVAGMGAAVWQETRF